jgi:IclR family acetate operon transcriptional repressor
VKNYQVINSVARSAEILKCLSVGVSRLTDIANRLRLNKAAVHRILNTLEIKGLVVRDPLSRQYFLGPVIQTIAANPLAVHRGLIQSSLREMEALGRACGETVVLQIMRGGHRVVLEKVAGNEMIRYFPENMETAPVHAGAGGQALLANLPDAELKSLLPRLNFEKLTVRTITSPAVLKSKIDRVRKDGYAISRGENVKNAMAIAVPITAYVCPAALVVVGPESRLEHKKEGIVNKLVKAGAVISKKLASLPGMK